MCKVRSIATQVIQPFVTSQIDEGLEMPQILQFT